MQIFLQFSQFPMGSWTKIQFQND